MKSSDPQLLQIPLRLGGFQQNDFASFLSGKNQPIIDLLHKIAENKVNHCIYLWGNPGTGKSHLLQATCKYASEYHNRVVYVPLEQIDELSPDIFHGFGELDLVCIDDLDFIGTHIEWQQALVCLYNELRDNKHSLLMSASIAPTAIIMELNDLKSRLNWDQVYQLIPSDDEYKIKILKQNAKARSFELNDEVIDYLMTRVDRDLSSLMRIMERIDDASLAAKRRITIPFLKSILEQHAILNKQSGGSRTKKA